MAKNAQRLERDLATTPLNNADILMDNLLQEPSEVNVITVSLNVLVVIQLNNILL